MAKTILRDVSVTVNAVDISDHVDTIEVDESWEQVDVTGMGAAAREILLGLATAGIKVTLFQDFAAASVDATLGPLAGSNTPFPVVVKPTSAAVGATNPSFTMQAVLANYTPLSGQVGKASQMSIEFLNADQSGLVRATA